MIPFLTHSKTILTHGVSRVVRDIIISCKNRKRLTVLVTAGGLERDGYFLCASLHRSVAVANELEASGIHTTLIPDSSVGYFMSHVNLVLMGAEAVVETGGILNKLGSLQIGVLAKTFNVPVYIATGRVVECGFRKRLINSLACIR